MNWNFVPDENIEAAPGEIPVPFYENARADFAPYYDNRTYGEAQAQSEVVRELSKMGGSSVHFQPGHFTVAKQKRFGYSILFRVRGVPALIRVAGLPLRGGETAKKVEKVRVQALLNVRDWLKTAVTTQVFTPGSSVLMPFLLADPERGLTVADLLSHRLDHGQIPRLTAGESE